MDVRNRNRFRFIYIFFSHVWRVRNAKWILVVLCVAQLRRTQFSFHLRAHFHLQEGGCHSGFGSPIQAESTKKDALIENHRSFLLRIYLFMYFIVAARRQPNKLRLICCAKSNWFVSNTHKRRHYAFVFHSIFIVIRSMCTLTHTRTWAAACSLPLPTITRFYHMRATGKSFSIHNVVCIQ